MGIKIEKQMNRTHGDSRNTPTHSADGAKGQKYPNQGQERHQERYPLGKVKSPTPYLTPYAEWVWDGAGTSIDNYKVQSILGKQKQSLGDILQAQHGCSERSKEARIAWTPLCIQMQPPALHCPNCTVLSRNTSGAFVLHVSLYIAALRGSALHDFQA